MTPLRSILSCFASKQLCTFAVGAACLTACTSEQCLLSEEIYSSSSPQKLAVEFESYLGTPEEADSKMFTTAVEDYLSVAYSVCTSGSDATKKCVRTKIDRIKDLLENIDRKTPLERMTALLSLSSPTSCVEDVAPRSSEELALWEQLSRNKKRAASEALKRLVEGKSAVYASKTSSTSLPASMGAKQSYARALYNRGVLARAYGNKAQASELLARSATLSAGRTEALYATGATALENNDFEQALRRAAAGRENFVSDPNHISPLELKFVLLQSAALRGLERFEAADDFLGKFRNKAITVLGETHPVVAHLYYEQAWMRAHRRGFGQAQSLLRKALKIAKKVFSESHPFVLDTQIAMAFLQVESGLADDALGTLKIASELNEALGRSELAALEIEFIRAMAYADLDRFLDRSINVAGKVLHELRRSQVSAPHLEARIERWLEAI